MTLNSSPRTAKQTQRGSTPRVPLPRKRLIARTRRCAGCGERVSTSVCPSCKTKRATKRSNIGKRCDALWSQIIKSPGKCFRCGATEGLQAAHIIGRAQRVVRWDLRNGICLCHRCHRLFDTYKLDRVYLIWRALGDYGTIDLYAKGREVWDKEYPLAELTAVLKAAKEKAS